LSKEETALQKEEEFIAKKQILSDFPSRFAELHYKK